MKLLKLGLISLVILFLLATVIGTMLPSKVLVSRAVNIKAPPDSVRVQIEDIREWPNWVEGMNDPSVYIQSSVNARIGKSEVTIAEKNDSAVISTWITAKGKPQISTIRLIYQPQQEVTIVQWQCEQAVGWLPWERLGSIMNDKIMGPMMEQNLEKLRQLIEAKNRTL
ncbi:MAG: hypothetical protein IBJ16_10630 [Chitinophagaceae bacterium]|nr:hypothetical protein [Chitinophagaceae bacterium]